MNRCLQGAHVPKWMTKAKTTLIQKDLSEGTAPNNHRPITYLPMIWKILTTQMREDIYYSLTSRGLFPEEQKVCRKRSRGIAELLCGPILVTELNVVWLLVPVLVVAGVRDYQISFRLFALSNPSVPTLCLKDPRSGVDIIQPGLLLAGR